jgi:4-amino-4-deoxy-L-arabinose transferase-like glycosyltransferase
LVEIVYILLIALGSTGVGLALLRKFGPIFSSRAEELVFSVGIGLGCLALSTMLLGLIGILYAPVFYLLLLVGLLLGRKELLGISGRLQGRLINGSPDWTSYSFGIAILIGLALALNLLRALMPPHGAVDPLAYHLALPSIYLSKHYLSFERTITGTLYPDNIGMLYTAAMGLRSAALAQVVHWFMGAMTVVAIWCFCRDYFNSQVGIFAAAIYAFTPVFVFFSPLAYVDVGVAFFQFLSLWALFKWMREGEERTLLLVGVLTGFAMGAKHTALFLGVASALMILVRLVMGKRTLPQIIRSLLLFGGVALLLALPWYVRAYYYSGNPVWPIANDFFGGLPYGSSFSLGKLSGSGASGYEWDRLLHLLYVTSTSLWEWAWNGQLGWQRATGILYLALTPVAFLYWQVTRVRWLILCSGIYYLLIVLYVDGNPRYNLAFFALMSILAGWGAQRFSGHRFRALQVIFKATFVVALLSSLAQSYALAYPAIHRLLARQNPEQYLLANEGNYKAFTYVNQHLSSSAKVLLQGIVKGYYCEREYMWDHPYQALLQYDDYETPEQLHAQLKKLGITHIVRMIQVPASRIALGYPQYFADPLQEAYRKRYLKLLYRDSGYVVFEVTNPG